ncbi:hypothetical protein QBC47DRAFT_336709 [Echria macrotheca]|uniref:Uncharacterized protein n=1 Tax=Echria macrotheca TaxID=438768 RepID=A0AAJ0BIR9_9PEZI|nr:hypothetical protein QBC47DRAFT_336709 [Echria macrotheca]
MDPVSLTLGIVPILGGSVKLYKSAHSKLKIARHFSREVDRIRRQFDRQKQFFLNEIRLLLRLVLDDESLIQEMVADGGHERWQSPRLNRALLDRLGDNCCVLEEVAEDVTKIINHAEEGLECFDRLEAVRERDERFKDTVKRVKSSLKVAFDKSKFDQWIADLRSTNEDLKLLREQVTELTSKPKTTCASMRSSNKKRLPSDFRSYGITRRASRALHDALWTAWSTRDAAHFRHVVRLFLETKADEGVQLNLAISCLDRNIIQQSMIKIHVKSQVLDWISTESISKTVSIPHPNLGPQDTSAPESKRRRVVRFFDEVESLKTLAPESPPMGKSSLMPTALDLRASQHFCSQLTPRHQHYYPQDHPGTRCVGFLETCSHDKFRHEFFHCWEGVCSPAICQGAVCETGTLKRLDQVLSQPRSDELSVQHQLQLALRIASAVLKFSSTPWLGEYWGLQDLQLFERDSDLPTSLQTIHLGTECTKVATNPASMEVDVSDSATSALDEAKLVHGIQNPTMYNLGVALLSIGRWKLFDPYDVLKARRIASQTCPLGTRYQELTRKVLDCDFGYGKDLKKPKLQEAVYDGVLLELEDMISALSFEEDS